MEKRGAKYHRERLGEAMREEIETIVEGELADPRIGLASVTSVELAEDARLSPHTAWRPMAVAQRNWRINQRKPSDLHPKCLKGKLGTMATTGSPPAKQSYIQQQRFHRATFASSIRSRLARVLPRGLRQRLRLRRRMEVVRDFALDGIDALLGNGKELVPPRRLNFVGHGDFIAIGDEFFRYFVELGGFAPGGKILEIGCGVGRMARPLTKYLTTGTYDGIDIVPKGISWCRKNISARFPNFKFHLADIHNLAYNPGGRLQALQYKFPFPKNTFDSVALTSVFSHMLTAEMEHYLRETARCLQPNGTALITFFLLNQESKDFIDRGLSALTFRFSRDGCKVNDDLVPEYAVAYEEETILRLCTQLALTVESLHYGLWCGRPQYLSYQDMLVVRKAG